MQLYITDNINLEWHCPRADVKLVVPLDTKGELSIVDKHGNVVGKVTAKAKHRGLGDSVKWVADKLGVKKQCGGCKDRQEKLNKAFPYKG